MGIHARVEDCYLFDQNGQARRRLDVITNRSEPSWQQDRRWRGKPDGCQHGKYRGPVVCQSPSGSGSHLYDGEETSESKAVRLEGLGQDDTNDDAAPTAEASYR